MINNKYRRWYLDIIKNAQSQNRRYDGTRYEKHHIVPRSIGGTDNPSNLILLTLKEHYVCHHLLTKFTIGKEKSKMIFAFWGMCNRWGRSGIEVGVTSAVYVKLKTQVSLLISKNNKGKSYPVADNTRQLLSESKLGSKNPMYGKPAHNRGLKRTGIGGRKKGTRWSESERTSRLLRREQPGYYDYLKDPERGKKISKATKGRVGAAKDKKWFNNGISETYSTACPEGFLPGRLPKKQSNKIGMKWYNNGYTNRQFKDDLVEEGFIRGRLSKK